VIDASFLRDDPAWPEAVACLRGVLSDVLAWDIDEDGERVVFYGYDSRGVPAKEYVDVMRMPRLAETAIFLKHEGLKKFLGSWVEGSA